jgi:cyclopropane fatty-acyl-phospholipid synthase-like methyltransferase
MLQIIVLALLFLFIVLLFCFFLLQLITLPFYLFAQTQGAFYAPIADPIMSKMLDLAHLKPGQKLLDLGSGDGKIVIAAAQRGIEAHGYEVNPLLVWQSRRNIKRAKLTHRAFVHWQNFWNVPLSDFDTITVYGIGYMMKRLEKKAQSELKSGSQIISYFFTFPNWKPTKKEKHIFIYQKK